MIALLLVGIPQQVDFLLHLFLPIHLLRWLPGLLALLRAWLFPRPPTSSLPSLAAKPLHSQMATLLQVRDKLFSILYAFHLNYALVFLSLVHLSMVHILLHKA